MLFLCLERGDEQDGNCHNQDESGRVSPEAPMATFDEEDDIEDWETEV